MASLSVKDCVTEMVREVLGPEMKRHNFCRRGRNFWRDSTEVCQIANVVLNRFGSREESTVFVHLGVFWHKVEKLLRNPSSGKMPPLEYHCTYRIDLGSTVSIPPKPDWEVTLKTDFGALGREMASDLTSHGLQWLEYRSDLAKTGEWERYNRKDRRGLMWNKEMINADARIVLSFLRGDRAGAIADLQTMVTNGFRPAALSLSKRLGIARDEVLDA